ncbi:hypothetical protein ACFK8Q_004393, partial [Salmonella enterica]
VNTSLSIDNYRKLPANNNVSGSSQTTGTRNRSTDTPLLHQFAATVYLHQSSPGFITAELRQITSDTYQSAPALAF